MNGGDNGVDWGARGSRRYLRRAVESSLRNLRTDWIDLYQLHRPDPATPIDETLSTLDDLVREGKIRYIGSSNFTGWQVADAEWTARTGRLTRFVSAQNHYSWLHREPEADLVPALEHYGIGLLPFFPLANGLLTGKYRRGEAAAGRHPHRRLGSRRRSERCQLRRHRGAGVVREEPRGRAARRRDRWPGGPARGVERHRRRDLA